MRCNAPVDSVTGFAIAKDDVDSLASQGRVSRCTYELEPEDCFCPLCGASVSSGATVEFRKESEVGECDGGGGFFSFSGRSGRAEFWKVSLLLMLLGAIVIGCVFFSIADLRELQYWNGEFSRLDSKNQLAVVLSGILGFACGVAMLPVQVRRCHDLGFTGWYLVLWWLLGWIPYVGQIVSLVGGIYLGFVRGVDGANEYGLGPVRHPLLAANRPRRSASEPASAEVRLRKLDELRMSDAISDEEYQRQRQKIISEI